MVDYFSVTLTLGCDRARLQLCGELDTFATHELSAAFDEACAAGPTLLLVDLADLSYCDSSGIRVLVLAAARCESEDIEIRLVGAQRNVRRIFELTNTAELLDLSPNGE
jgi:anti-anti-sigma factor